MHKCSTQQHKVVFYALAFVYGLTCFAVNAQSSPPQLTFDYQDDPVTLNLSGQTTRQKFFFDIYDIAHYMQWSEIDANNTLSSSQATQLILSGDYPQQIDIVFKRNLKANQIAESLIGGLLSNCKNDEYHQISDSVDLFKQTVSVNVSKDTLFSLRWLPDGSVEAFHNEDKLMALHDPMFARILWSVWFGQDSVVDRDELLSHKLTVE